MGSHNLCLKTFSYVVFRVHRPYYSTRKIHIATVIVQLNFLPPGCATRIANNKEQAVSPKSAYMKTQLSPPKSMLSGYKIQTTQINCLKLFLVSNSSYVTGLTALVSLGLLIVEALVSRTNTPHSVALPWTNDQSITKTSTRQHSQETDIHVRCGIRTRYHIKQVATGPCLRPCGHLARSLWHLVDIKYSLELSFTTPVCNSLKCLFISCVQKSEFGIQKMD
jgi:hypothetical protein